MQRHLPPAVVFVASPICAASLAQNPSLSGGLSAEVRVSHVETAYLDARPELPILLTTHNLTPSVSA
jgi:hypothetical protein